MSKVELTEKVANALTSEVCALLPVEKQKELRARLHKEMQSSLKLKEFA